MTIQKQERDIAYKEEEIRSVKNIAREVAEQLRPQQKREDKFTDLLTVKDNEIQARDIQIAQLTETISALKAELNDASRESNKVTDLRLQFESKIDTKEEAIQTLREENVRFRDEVRGKDLAIQALSDTLIDRGEDNMKLVEKLSAVKNHQLQTQYLNQSYLVYYISKKGIQDMLVRHYYFSNCIQFRFVSDMTVDYHFFLEIREKTEKSNKKPARFINMLDVKSIEPNQKMNFTLQYYENI